MVLLTPGPSMTSPTVRAAAAGEDMNHRDPAYRSLSLETRDRLLTVYPELREGWSPYLLGGSGTAAVEAALGSCVEFGPVLVIENGYYGGRAPDILSIYGVPRDVFSLPWTESWTDEAIERIERMLSARKYEAVFVVHNETTLGRLNPIERIGGMCHTHGSRLIVDAMSSFGADSIPFDRIDVLISSANKCLHGLPGLSFVLARRELAVAMRGFPRRTFYLSLPMYEGEDPPLTPPVPAMRAFCQALRENPGGQAVRAAEYRRKIDRLRNGLADLGFSFAVSDGESSCTMAAPSLPSGWSFERWFAANYEVGFEIYGCKGELRDRYFQASVMGEVTEAGVAEWISRVGEILGSSRSERA